jgi:hypothetical protein
LHFAIKDARLNSDHFLGRDLGGGSRLFGRCATAT